MKTLFLSGSQLEDREYRMMKKIFSKIPHTPIIINGYDIKYIWSQIIKEIPDFIVTNGGKISAMISENKITTLNKDYYLTSNWPLNYNHILIIPIYSMSFLISHASYIDKTVDFLEEGYNKILKRHSGIFKII